MKENQLRAKKQRLAYAQKRAKELGITVAEYINAKKERKKERKKEQSRKIKMANARFKAKVLTGEIPHALESMSVFVEVAYRDVQIYVKRKFPAITNKEEVWRTEDVVIDTINKTCLKKLKASKLLGKYQDGWEVIGAVVAFNFSVSDKKAFSLIKGHFKRKSFLQKFKIYSYAYYIDNTEELMGCEVVLV